MYVSPCKHIMHVCLYAHIEQHTHTLKTVPRERAQQCTINLPHHTTTTPSPSLLLNNITDLSGINTCSLWYSSVLRKVVYRRELQTVPK